MNTGLLYDVRTRLALSIVAAMLGLGCSSDMNNDSAGKQMNLGISEARSGLSRTQTGLGQIRSSDRNAGMSNIDSGMGMVNQGVADMRSGMNMMSSGMMTNCMDGGGAGMMNSIQQATDEMRTGQMMFQSDASTDDTEASTHMSNGQTMMGAALDQAKASMNCMGHGNMMSGGGMM